MQPSKLFGFKRLWWEIVDEPNKAVILIDNKYDCIDKKSSFPWREKIYTQTFPIYQRLRGRWACIREACS